MELYPFECTVNKGEYLCCGMLPGCRLVRLSLELKLEFTNGFGFNSLPASICIEIIYTEVDEEMRGRASSESP